MTKLVSYFCDFCEKTFGRELDFEPFECPGCGRLYQFSENPMVNIFGFDFEVDKLQGLIDEISENRE